MRTRTLGSMQRQRGYTLMEILVAVAIFATVMIVALLLYDQSNRVFKRANESAEMQQNTRVAFEKVVADLRMAGFDYKRAGTPKAGVPQLWTKDTAYSVGTMITPSPPNGHVYRSTKAGTSGATAPTWKTGLGELVPDNTTEWQESGAPVYEQPDEQIEFAHDKAITIRANYDYEDPTTPDHGRETDLEVSSGGSFPIVTTGNDEIVTYALVSRSGNASANQDKISFFADVQVKNSKPARLGYPGGQIEKEITITGVDFTNKYPPYTLMRYTLNAAGAPVGTALADNIRSMTFSYWQDYAAKEPLTDIANTKVTDFTTVAGVGAFDPTKPNEVVPGRLIRGKVRAVTATIVGMSPQPDYDYTSPTDTVASNFRQYELQSTIVGRNLGLKGIPQTETDPPGPPTLTNSCTGYCGVAFLTWAPAPNTGNVTYTVLYDTSAGGSFQGVLPAGTQTSYAVDLTQFDLTKTWYFRVAATNDAGTTVSEGSPLALDLRNRTKPMAPAQPVVTTGLTDSIEVTFNPTPGNASGLPSCSAGGTPAPNYPAEVRGYRVYRSKDPAFDPAKGEGDLVLDETMAGLGGTGAGGFKFVDTKIANCTQYYYRVAAVEWCEQKAAYNTTNDVATGLSDFSPASAAGASKATAKPKAPLNLKQDVNSVCNPGANTCNPVKLNWEKVIKDVSENDVLIETYRITRRRSDSMAISRTVDISYDAAADTNLVTWTDTDLLLHHDPADPSKEYTYEYKVTAVQNCTPELESDAATLTYPGKCVLGAAIVPDADGPGAGTFDAPMANVRSLTVVPDLSKAIKEVTVSIDGATPATPLDPPYTLEWDVEDGERHTISFNVTGEECTEVLTFYVQSDPADCAIRTAVSQVKGATGQTRVVLANISENDVMLDSVDIRWLGQTVPSVLSWQNVKFPVATYTATTTGTQTGASPRTVTFIPNNAGDRLIKKGETMVLLMNFTGGAPDPSRVGGLSSDYKEVTVTTQFGCGSQLVSCAVTATINAPALGQAINIDIKNNSTEAITLTGLEITWAGQADWVWASTSAGGTYPNTPASAGGTKAYTVTGMTIGAGDTGRATMNMTPTKANPKDLLPANVTLVWTEYKTPTSAQGTLTCRVK